MTSSAFPIRASFRRPTYARARLLLGITGVGTAALAAASILVSGASKRLLSNAPDQPLVGALASLALVFAASMLAFLLFDMVGGALLVRRRERALVWFARWARGALTQWGLWMAGAAALMWTARLAMSHLQAHHALLASLGVFVALQLVLAAFRGALAGVAAALPKEFLTSSIEMVVVRAGLNPQYVRVVDTPDEGFVGGHADIRGRMLLVPLRWTQMPEPALLAALVRRQIIAESGAHTRGVLSAVLWNSAGFAFVLWQTDATPATASGIVTIAAAMTLWSFFGVLLLPTVSRAAVYAVDRVAAQRAGVGAVIQSIELLDRWQDDESSRTRIVETIFHPVPSRAARVQQLSSLRGARVRWFHAHHIARHALWLSWSSFTPLSRLVHCNVGRTALWVMLPGD